MSLIDRAKSHFEALGIQSIEIEEWPDEDGKPSVIYWKPITLAEKKKLFTGSSNLNDVGILADIVIMKALDKDGNSSKEMDNNQAKGTTAEECARQIIRGVEKEQHDIAAGGSELKALKLKRFFPKLFYKVIRKQSAK